MRRGDGDVVEQAKAHGAVALGRFGSAAAKLLPPTEIREVQGRLLAFGFDPGRVDGDDALGIRVVFQSAVGILQHHAHARLVQVHRGRPGRRIPCVHEVVTETEHERAIPRAHEFFRIRRHQALRTAVPARAALLVGAGSAAVAALVFTRRPLRRGALGGPGGGGSIGGGVVGRRQIVSRGFHAPMLEE